MSVGAAVPIENVPGVQSSIIFLIRGGDIGDMDKIASAAPVDAFQLSSKDFIDDAWIDLFCLVEAPNVKRTEDTEVHPCHFLLQVELGTVFTPAVRCLRVYRCGGRYENQFRVRLLAVVSNLCTRLIVELPECVTGVLGVADRATVKNDVVFPTAASEILKSDFKFLVCSAVKAVNFVRFFQCFVEKIPEEAVVSCN